MNDNDMNSLIRKLNIVFFVFLSLFVSQEVKTETSPIDIDEVIMAQSTVMRCLLEEKILTKDQAIKMMQDAASVHPQLFNPVIKIVENGANVSQKKTQDTLIRNTMGCKNMIRLYVDKTFKEDDAELMMKTLDKTGFNDDLLGRPKSYFDKDQGLVFCKEPIPEFTLNYDSNPSDKEVTNLCSCIWNKFPEGRWERNEMRRIFKGGNPNLKTRGFLPRMGKAMKVCGGYEL